MLLYFEKNRKKEPLSEEKSPLFQMQNIALAYYALNRDPGFEKLFRECIG